MRLGLVARADNSGLGVQTWELARHLRPAKTLVIDVGHLHDNTLHCNKATFLDRYPGAMVCQGWQPSTRKIVEFLRGLDVVVTCETPYGPDLIPTARGMGVRSIICPNFEFLDRSLKPDLWAAPSMWRWDEIPEPKTFLPVPIALDRFGKTPDSVGSGIRHFLHIVGRPAIFDRNGTPDLLGALRHVRSQIRLTLKCQDVDYLNRLLSETVVPPNVDVTVDTGDVENYWELYRDGDVFVMPRKFGGLCLPANEALGAGMPVIMTDIDPNNTWLPAEWLTPACKVAQFQAANHVDVYAPNVHALAALIDRFASDDAFFSAAKANAAELAQQLSWETLKPVYEKVLKG